MSGLLKGLPVPSIASTSQERQEVAMAEKRTLRVTLLSSEWRSSTNGDVSTINRELAIQLAKHPNVQVSVFLPQCSEEDKNIAASHKVKLIEAENMPGVHLNSVDWLINVPESHCMDCIIGHGVHLGRQIPIIKRQHHHCKWIQVVHNAPEELGMYKSISEGERLQQTEIELCELADQVVAVGPKLTDAYKRYLRSGKKQQDVLNLTPSIFTEFLEVKQATEERKTFCVLVIGSGDCEDFNLKGYDLAAQAIAELKDKSYQLRFVCGPAGKGGETADKLLQHGIARDQLIVRSFKESRKVLARLFCEVDLVIMPSRTEGFGLTALEALSAGLPVLVSCNSGLGEALKEVPNGSQCVVDSDHPEIWAKKIKAVRQKSREVRLAEANFLREKYLEKYSWQESCGLLLEKMQDLVFGLSQNRPSSTKKDKRPLSLFGTQPSKRLREELTEPDPHEGPPCFLPSSVELSQFPSTMASQIHEGHSYQRSHIQSSSGHSRPTSSVQYNQMPFMAVTQTPTQMYQTRHTQSSTGRLPSSVEHSQLHPTVARGTYKGPFHPQSFSGHSGPASSVEHSQLPFAAVEQPPTQLYQTSHTQRFPGFLPPSVEHSQLPSTVASQIQEGHSYHRSHIQGSPGFLPPSVEHSQFPPTGASQTYKGPFHTHSSSGHGRPALSVEHSQLPFAAVEQPPMQLHHTSHTQRFPGFLLSSVEHSPLPSTMASQIQEGHDSYQRSHIQGSSGHGRLPSVVEHSQLPFTAAAVPQMYQMGQSQSPFPAATQTHGELTFWRSHHPQGPSGYGCPPVECNQLSFPVATQTYGETTFQGTHTQMQGSFGYGLQPPGVISSQLPLAASNQTHEEPHYPRSHSSGSFGWPPSSMRHNQLPHAADIPTHEEPTFQRSHHTQSSFGWPPSSMRHSQLPHAADIPTHEEPTFQRSHHTQSSSCLDKLPPSVEYSQLYFPVATPITDKPSYQRSHTQSSSGHGRLPSSVENSQLPFTAAAVPPMYQMQGSFGYGLPHSSVISSQLPFGAATPTHREPTFQRSHQTQSHGLSVFLRILKAEYNRRSLLKPLLWENTVKLPLEEVYTRLSIVSRRKTDFQLQSNEVNMYDIFKTLNKGQDAMVLVEGSPGIGKTTFCQKLSYDWANENIPNEFSFPVFQLMLLLKCRDINGDVMEVISEQLLPEDTDDKVKKEIMDYIKDVHNQEKILIILDGLDELSKTAEQHVDKLLHRRILPFCYVLATSRQERGIVVRQQVDFDILLQIEGFTEEDAFDYIRKHFRHFGPEHLSKGERLIKAIQENTFLHALPSNPLNLLLLCVVFEQYQGDLPSSRTELYQIIVRCLLRRYCAKQKLKVPDDDKALEKQFEDSLLTLGELAWRCLQKDRHSFCEEELTRFESNNKDLAARKIGLVFKEASVKRINPQHEYHFFHKTFQEYLAALYLAHKILKEEVNVDFQLEFYKDITGKYRQVFLFVSGILGDDASVLFRQIGKMLKSKHWDWNKCSKEEATFFTESFNESRNAEQVAMALCSFIPFPLTVDLVCSRNGCTGVLTVVNACKSFSQLQHPLHLTVTIKTKLTDSNTVVDFLASWPHLRTLSFSIGFLSVGPLADTLFTALSKKSTLTSFTDQLLQRINDNTYWRPDFTLAASKTATTVTLKLADEQNEAWAITLTGLSPDTPLTSVVLKIYSSTSNTAMQTLKNVLSNKYITSLVLIIYGEMTDSQATAVRERLAAKGILKSLTLIVYGKLSYNGAVSLKKGLLENSSLNSLKVKVFGELPDNWVTITENVLVAKKPLMSVTVHPSVTGNITEEQVVCLCRAFKLQSLTLSLWGELSCSGAEALCKLLMESSTSCVTLNIHGNVSDDVADCFLRHLKLCKTLSTLSINIWGELTKEGNSALQELSCNQRCSFALIAPSSTSDEWICKDLNFSTTYVSQSLTSVLSKLKDTSKKKLSLVIPAHGYMSGDWARGLGDGLAKNTSLTTLSLKFDSCSDMSEDWARGLGDGLAKNTSLTTLSLKFDSCSDMSEDWARGLGNGLAKNTSLTTLSLTFNSCNVMFGFWDLGLGNCLANNTSLTTLSLTFNSCIDMSKVWDLNNTSLTTLSLTFDSCIDMSEDWDLGLGDGLANNTSLTTLSLTFNSYCDTSEDWGLGLGNGLANNTSLTTLSLTFDSYYDMSGDWGLGLGNGLANNTSLTTLSLTFDSYCDMNGDWGLGLGDGLANNTSLTTLSLTFDSYCDMSEDWGLGLGNGLANNTSLTTLSLTFDSYCDMSGDWGLGLGNGLANNTSLTTLSLTFDSYCDMSGDWGLGLGNGLANNTSLTTLSVTFDSYSVMSGDWARGLDNGLANNTSLTTLSLTFNSCFDMSGDWAHGLGDGLAKNTSLTLLSVTFNNYVGSTGDWVRGLGDGLAKNASLTTLSLTLNSHSDLSEDWASGLGDGLAKNTSLASVSVTLNDYSGMSEDWLNNLCDSLAKSDTIASLSLTINYYSDTSKLLGCDLSKCLANCKSLTSLNLTVSLYGESIEC
ncbi:uncharacterized protein LOC144637526 isoform X1 [Oculina patagonica]